MSTVFSFLVHPIRKEVQNPKDESHPLKIGRLENRSSALVGTGVLPTTLDDSTIMCHNMFITMTNVAHQPYSRMACGSLTTISSTFILSFFPQINEEEKEDMATQQSREEEF